VRVSKRNLVRLPLPLQAHLPWAGGKDKDREEEWGGMSAAEFSQNKVEFITVFEDGIFSTAFRQGQLGRHVGGR
jgi:hypothetical protein